MPLLDTKSGVEPFSLPKSRTKECKKRPILPIGDHITNLAVVTYPHGACLAENRDFVNVANS
jgi:hypothetical protein